MDIRSRKNDHVESARKRGVEYSVSAGFSDVRLVHEALPELGFEAIDSSCSLFGRKLSAPIIMLGMTGGYPEARRINLALAEAAEKELVAFGLGSQRAMLEKPELINTYQVRKVAPSIPIIGNIGGCQLGKYSVKKVREMLDAVEADALAIHLNPLQELCQKEGDREFFGVEKKIAEFCRDLGLPVIVKETGAGISAATAARLKKAGVRMVDVSGAGGTSWSKVEHDRGGDAEAFGEWGNPTCECIAACSDAIETVGSGGVRSGVDAAKCIALGASYAGAALPYLKSNSPAALAAQWKHELRMAMLLSGSKNIHALKRAKLVITGRTAEAMKRLGVGPNRFARR